ncbi:MAG: DUF6644 family protein [Terracidiphilus sp.]|jgi:uncharacterized protein DUF6644
MSLLALFQWLSHSAVGVYMQQSQWAFAVVETTHLLGLAALGGSLIVVSLRALGLLARIASRQLARELLPIAILSFVAIAVSGVLMVSGEALKCYYSPAFRAKMAALAIALIISLPVYFEQIRHRDERLPWWHRVGAALSLLSWLSVGIAGRAIGFL